MVPPWLIEPHLALVAYYGPWPLTFLRCHHFFRFVGRFDAKGNIVGWDKQPSHGVEPDFEKTKKQLSPDWPYATALSRKGRYEDLPACASSL